MSSWSMNGGDDWRPGRAPKYVPIPDYDGAVMKRLCRQYPVQLRSESEGFPSS